MTVDNNDLQSTLPEQSAYDRAGRVVVSVSAERRGGFWVVKLYTWARIATFRLSLN